MKKKLGLHIVLVLFIIAFTLIAISYQNIYTSFLDNKNNNIKKVINEKESELFDKEEALKNLLEKVVEKRTEKEKLNNLLKEKENQLKVLQKN
ncbi:MAG: hypothetical protein KID00_16970 [Clostridium argentinense]|uniref:Uncharacterized protein n=1 Tax=Clostridium faecium TaxID=2762223 RepID=A0ABR8YMQ5_9CLOT|nr:MULTISPECIES: hypothetical protein [Clostridium]MBD8045471.1 hypothetical protein [Clostridium faecium]MBS5825507.1 hypothetical protein [Clostridium argentinense]MDU1348900.1 hypothetical protein [Clostridium argentinense]